MEQAAAPSGRSWILGLEEVESWLASAGEGERLHYGGGPRLARGETSRRLLDASLAGEVKLFQPRSRSGDGFDFLAVRSGPPAPKVVAMPRDDQPMLQILAALKEAARAKRPCPSNAELGDRVGLEVPQVKWRVRKLEQLKLVAVELVDLPSRPRFRIVTIVGTGWQTAVRP